MSAAGLDDDPASLSDPSRSAYALLNRPAVTVDVAAELLGISRASAFRAVHRGELPAIRIGRRIVVPTAGLRALLHVGDPNEEVGSVTTHA